MLWNGQKVAAPPTSTGVEIMCRQFEEVLAMGEARGEARGRAEGKAEEKETARLLDLAIEEVRQAAARQKAASACL